MDALRRSLRIPGLAAYALAIAVGAAACGGGGGGGNKPATTKAQYASAVSKLCQGSADQVRELHLDQTVDSWKHDGDQVVKIGQQFMDKLNALTPPDEIKAPAQEFVDTNQKAFDDTKDAVSAAKAGDATKLLAAIKKGNTDNLATFPSAKEIGAKGCYIG